LLGYICLGRREEGRCFTSADQKLIISVARQTAAVLENVRLQRSEWEKQRMANELKLARKIQDSLHPQDFSFADFLCATGISEPCQEIGGDYFDFFPLNPDRALLVIADVTGKGPPAALQASMIQGIVHGVSCQRPEPSSLMSTLNECVLRRALEGNNVSVFLATLDDSGRLQYTNGGHNPPLWIQVNGQVTELSEGGLLLGFLKSAEYTQNSIQLSPGDLLLLYTDGVTDAEDPHGNPFGAARLLNWACRQAGRSPAEVKESLVSEVSQFCRGTRQADDLTVLVVQYTGRTGLAGKGLI
jgi:sigma-B regulation protein RsbU (phosphoserine phosphatase)